MVEFLVISTAMSSCAVMLIWACSSWPIRLLGTTCCISPSPCCPLLDKVAPVCVCADMCLCTWGCILGWAWVKEILWCFSLHVCLFRLRSFSLLYASIKFPSEERARMNFLQQQGGMRREEWWGEFPFQHIYFSDKEMLLKIQTTVTDCDCSLLHRKWHGVSHWTCQRLQHMPEGVDCKST